MNIRLQSNATLTDVALVSRAGPALWRRPCFATSVPDPLLSTAAYGKTTLAARSSRTLWQTVFVSTCSFSRSPRGSPPQWRGASSYGKTPRHPTRSRCPRRRVCVRRRAYLPRAGQRLRLVAALTGRSRHAAARLLPRAEAALRQELQQVADVVKEGQSSSSSVSRALGRPEGLLAPRMESRSVVATVAKDRARARQASP